MASLHLVLCLVALVGCVRAAPSKRSPTIGTYNFTQLVNHFPNKPYYDPAPASKTFPMQYIVNDTFYKPGGPVICLLGGEVAASSRMDFLETGIVRILAEATNGLGVILEHRYYGNSYPVEDLSTDNLRWLTTEQILADVAYFAQHVEFPGHENEDLTAPKTPWILCT